MGSSTPILFRYDGRSTARRHTKALSLSLNKLNKNKLWVKLVYSLDILNYPIINMLFVAYSIHVIHVVSC